jgi:hypothetical protein
MRYRTKHDIPFDIVTLEHEFQKIIHRSTIPKTLVKPVQKTVSELCLIRIPPVYHTTPSQLQNRKPAS